MKINILGTEYNVKIVPRTHKKMEDADGLAELYSKEILLCQDEKDDIDAFDNIESYYHKVLRHEAFHALFAEMGIRKWFDDEDLVDMLAMQYPKIKAIMDKCDSVNIYDLGAEQTDCGWNRG